MGASALGALAVGGVLASSGVGPLKGYGKTPGPEAPTPATAPVDDAGFMAGKGAELTPEKGTGHSVKPGEGAEEFGTETTPEGMARPEMGDREFGVKDSQIDEEEAQKKLKVEQIPAPLAALGLLGLGATGIALNPLMQRMWHSPAHYPLSAQPLIIERDGSQIAAGPPPMVEQMEKPYGVFAAPGYPGEVSAMGHPASGNLFPIPMYIPPGAIPLPTGQYLPPGAVPPPGGQYYTPGTAPPLGTAPPVGQYLPPGAALPPVGQYYTPGPAPPSGTAPPPAGQYYPPGIMPPMGPPSGAWQRGLFDDNEVYMAWVMLSNIARGSLVYSPTAKGMVSPRVFLPPTITIPEARPLSPPFEDIHEAVALYGPLFPEVPSGQEDRGRPVPGPEPSSEVEISKRGEEQVAIPLAIPPFAPVIYPSLLALDLMGRTLAMPIHDRLTAFETPSLKKEQAASDLIKEARDVLTITDPPEAPSIPKPRGMRVPVVDIEKPFRAPLPPIFDERSRRMALSVEEAISLLGFISPTSPPAPPPEMPSELMPYELEPIVRPPSISGLPTTSMIPSTPPAYLEIRPPLPTELPLPSRDVRDEYKKDLEKKLLHIGERVEELLNRQDNYEVQLVG